MACVAALPLVTSITRGLAGGAYALTTEYYHLPKLLALALLATLATSGWVADVILNRREPRLGRIWIPLAAFAALALVSTAFAYEPLSSLFGATGLMTGTITWLLCIWFGFLVAQYATSGPRLRQLSWALVGGCTAVGAIVLLQALGADPLATPSTPDMAWTITRGIATVGNPDFTGVLLVFPAALAIGLALSAGGARERLIAAGCAFVLVVAEVITLTRGAWIGLFLGVVCLALLARSSAGASRGRVWLWLLGGAVLAAALGVAIATPEQIAGRLAGLFKNADTFSSGRITMWRDTLKVISDRPWFGTGADGLIFGTYHVQSDVIILGVRRFALQDPHSLPLLVAGVFGIPALVALGWLLVAVCRSAWQRISRTDASLTPSQTLFASWIAGFAGLLAASLLSVWTITAVFVLFLGLGVLASPSLKAVATKRAVWAIGCAAGGVLVVAASLFGAGRSFAADRNVALAAVSDPQVHYEKALRLIPWDSSTQVNYLWRKINGYSPYLLGADAAQAQTAAAEIDAEIGTAIANFPDELFLYRLRIDLYSMMKGYAGYEPDKALAAVDAALAAFPGDSEFTQKRKALLDAN